MLLTTIAGIRGTIGGKTGDNLTPVDIVSFISAYGAWNLSKKENPTIVVGRDGRKSGDMILNLAVSTLRAMGINVISLGLATTPTVEMQVVKHLADGGIIITASHNPKEYNGIKMLNDDGEFISEEAGEKILEIARDEDYTFAGTDGLGRLNNVDDHTEQHIDDILNLDLVDAQLVASKKYTIAVDGINSVGGVAVPILLEKMGVNVVGLYMNPDGEFAHKPEPLEENLGDLQSLVKNTDAHLGIAVDPDVDRLVFIDENGKMLGEEYTIVSIADYILSEKDGDVVSNLSSSRALRDLAEKHGREHFVSRVGERHVVDIMKESGAVFGGEGNGGVIYPELHYGRDGLVGIALFLTYLAKRNITPSLLRREYTDYFMAKEKVVLNKSIDVDAILEHFWNSYQSEKITNIDGVKIDFNDSWVHLRKSNTEPIMRVYTEAESQDKADTLAERFINEINNIN